MKQCLKREVTNHGKVRLCNEGDILMNKCLVVTLIGGADNYGAELQNYAVQNLLKELGYEPETYFERNSWQEFEVAAKCYVKDKVKFFLKKSYGLYGKRRRCFSYFRKNYISASKYHKKELAKAADAYDWFIVGSDQVWNPYYNSFDDTMMLKFAKPGRKIAFCASMGVKQIPEVKINEFSDNLPLFNAVSVREKDAVGILQPFCKKKFALCVILHY